MSRLEVNAMQLDSASPTVDFHGQAMAKAQPDATTHTVCKQCSQVCQGCYACVHRHTPL